MSPVLFDLQAVPFSCYGAYVSFSHTHRNVADGVYLRHIAGGVQQPEIFRLQVLSAHQPIALTTHLTPAKLRLESAAGFVEICFEQPDMLRLHGEGVALSFSADSSKSDYDTAWQSPDGDVHTISYAAEIKCRFGALRGYLTLDAPWLGVKTEHMHVTIAPDSQGVFDAYVYLFRSTCPTVDPLPTFDAAHQRTVSAFEAWRAQTLPVPATYAPAHELAAYIQWSSVVAPRGNFAVPAMLMSKNWMSKIWGWDNCFNALALAQYNPQLAWQQLMLFVMHQHEDGAFPDHITDTTRSFRFYKPPVYGWVLRAMQAHGHLTADRIAEIYAPLCRWTVWWLTHRDDDGDGLPQYNHGNESGWDNGTVFAHGVPVESPDLATYLIIQMDVLADFAETLGLPDEAQAWRSRADALQIKMLDAFWTGERFIARHAFTHEAYTGDSLLVDMPLLLGDRLPQVIREKLVADVRRFVTTHGLSTEHVSSPYYTDDGYWRGPIWAPSTYLIVDGLRACSHDDLAEDIARRFCALALHNGMAENYDAQTGQGLRDRAYTWTASVFLLLGAWLFAKETA